MKDTHIILFLGRPTKYGTRLERLETPQARLTGRQGTRAGVPWYEVEYEVETIDGLIKTKTELRTDWFNAEDILFVQETLH